MKEIKVTLTVVLAAGIVLSITSQAQAINVPASGSFAYDVYDIAINSILKGPIGFVGGVSAIVLGAIAAIRAQIVAAIPAILGGAAVIKADTITKSLGLLI